MKEKEIEKLEKEIKTINSENLQNLMLLIKQSVSNLLNYMTNVKVQTDIPKQLIKIIFDFWAIIKEEKKIYDFLLLQAKYTQEEDVNNFLAEIADLNEQTFTYFYNYLNHIQNTIGCNQHFKNPQKRKITLLTESDEYQKKACNIVLTKDLIKELLDYEKEFWDFIESKTLIIPTEDFKVDWFYNDNNVEIVKVLVPEVRNLNTALINIQAFSSAYILYSSPNVKKSDGHNTQDDIKSYYLKMTNYFKK